MGKKKFYLCSPPGLITTSNQKPTTMPKVLRERHYVFDIERQQLFLRGASINSETTLSKLNEKGTHHTAVFKRFISVCFFSVEEGTVLDWISQLNHYFVRTFTEHVPSCTHMGGFGYCGGEDRNSIVYIFNRSNFHYPPKYGGPRTLFQRSNGGKARRKVEIDIPTSVFIELTKWLLGIIDYHLDMEADDKPEEIEIRHQDNSSKRWFSREWVGKVLEIHGLPSDFVKITQDPNKRTRLRLSV